MVKNKSGKARFNEIRNLCKSVTYCQKANYGCGAPIPKIKLESKKSTSTITIVAEVNLSTISAEEGSGNLFDGKKKIKQIITPEMCYNILKNISDKDCEIIGLDPTKTRPEMMILKYFPVPPNHVRPSSKLDFFSSISSSITNKFCSPSPTMT
jgi:DNA-directed RNA polymerase II subunit RPB1